MAVLNTVSPLGTLTICEDGGHIVRLGWDDDADDAPTPLLHEAARQLGKYFAGELTRFDLPLKPEGSDFGKRVWQAMSAIPYGETATYGALAQRLGSSARAVGGACGANPIPVIVPSRTGEAGLKSHAAGFFWRQRMTKRYLTVIFGTSGTLCCNVSGCGGGESARFRK